jgi:hypothetical protein
MGLAARRCSFLFGRKRVTMVAFPILDENRENGDNHPLSFHIDLYWCRTFDEIKETKEFRRTRRGGPGMALT